MNKLILYGLILLSLAFSFLGYMFAGSYFFEKIVSFDEPILSVFCLSIILSPLFYLVKTTS